MKKAAVSGTPLLGLGFGFFLLSGMFSSGAPLSAAVPQKPPRSLAPITYEDFKKAEEKDPYYKGRWRYFEKVIEIIKKEPPESALEIGPYKLPIVKNSDTMDIDRFLPDLTYRCDAGNVPWPIEDSKYDLCLALQVWEHLGNNQQKAFKEIMRVSRRAILSFPCRWNTPGDIHHAIDEEKIAAWTLHVKPEAVIKAEPDVLIYYFKFRERPSSRR